MSGWSEKRTPYMSYTSRSDQLAVRQIRQTVGTGVASSVFTLSRTRWFASKL